MRDHLHLAFLLFSVHLALMGGHCTLANDDIPGPLKQSLKNSDHYRIKRESQTKAGLGNSRIMDDESKFFTKRQLEVIKDYTQTILVTFNEFEEKIIQNEKEMNGLNTLLRQVVEQNRQFMETNKNETLNCKNEIKSEFGLLKEQNKQIMDAIAELKQNSVTTQNTKEETGNLTSVEIMEFNSTVQALQTTPTECICSSNNTQSKVNPERVILPAGIYEGARIKPNNANPVYLILDGTKRHIPNPDTYNKLFKNWDGIQSLDASTVDQVPLGLPLTNGAYLLKGDDHPVYLVSDGIKRHIANPHVFNTFNFSWGKIVTSQATAVAIPTGRQIR